MKKLKKSHLAIGLMALTIISAVGISSATLAAGTNTTSANTLTAVRSHLGMGRAKGADNLQTNATREANLAAREVKRTAVEAALKANDYNAWVAAEGANAPILKTINASKFSRFVEAHNLREQSDTIMTELGVTKGEGRGMGMGMGGQFDAK